jgi:hypothetical protein
MVMCDYSAEYLVEDGALGSRGYDVGFMMILKLCTSGAWIPVAKYPWILANTRGYL